MEKLNEIRTLYTFLIFLIGYLSKFDKKRSASSKLQTFKSWMQRGKNKNLKKVRLDIYFSNHIMNGCERVVSIGVHFAFWNYKFWVIWKNTCVHRETDGTYVVFKPGQDL